ncbi:alanyl-tRNA editing protein [Anaeromyxobacter paludicola]|uniref:Alanyl-tRNA editing protein n=1 Tax=Anaeromyxobacter paludicola TaxID=2918171 RepID=A0ABN6N429_9BACT|nr:alanyl-tRNA editing protein [Anaeromyxobacter paludicola]BDG07300.1 alanyl-tRNA editing protein [Anaeromyxobacter paludicola]
MTERLYLDDPDLLRFRARLLASRQLAGRPAAVLDRTAFYPEGGGQPADRGRLGGVEVVDVREVEGEVLHVLAGELPPGEVDGAVDGARRRDHLQQHHGQHLLSAAFEATAGARTTSFHLGAETCTIDLDAPLDRLGPAELRAAEAHANDLVFRDLPVTAREYAPEELAALPLRKEAVKGSRVVVVGAPGEVLDASPCGGTHPRRTGAVGAIAVLRAVKWGAGARVEFLCGARVVGALAEAGRRLAEAAAPLRCAPAELPAAVARLADEGAARRKELDRLLAALAAAEAERLLAAAAPGPIRAVVSPPAAGAAGYAKAVALALAARGRVALLGAVEDGRAHLAFARPKGDGPHLGELVRRAAAALGGKGGGSPDAAQGSGPEAAGLEAALDEAARGAQA